ncbi:hypothetical protein HA466_0011380 [Hirschfeldia incana]|nr:hypothetical protein HA466_0011380 [Hirschfeldia incana]
MIYETLFIPPVTYTSTPRQQRRFISTPTFKPSQNLQPAKFSVHQAMVSNDKHQKAFLESAKAQAELKFTYVFSCQVYGNQKKSGDIHNTSCYTNILQLMLKYPSLRVAYVDEREETTDAKSLKVFYFFSSKEMASFI